VSENLARKRLRTSGVTVIISLSLVLFMLGILGLVIINASKLSTHFRENVGFQVFLKDTATSAQTDLLMQEINDARFSKKVTFVSKEEAAVSLKEDLGEDFISLMGSNPLLNSINIKLNAEYAQSDTLAIIEKALMKKPFVKEVVYQKIMIDRLNKNTRAVALFILIFSTALLIVAIALINNTIRLSIYSKRFLIRTMYLVGATKGFISKPFILKGCRQGVIAGVVAGLLLGLFLTISLKYIPDLLAFQDENLLVMLFGGMIVTGIVISALSALFAVSRYLNLKTSDLYF
jgi:cell division transport system permease protein